MPAGKDRYPTYVPLFLALDKAADIVRSFSKLTEVDDFLKLVQPPSSVCVACGREFTLSSYTKRDMCDDCYKSYRKKYCVEKKRAARAKIRTQKSV